MYSNDWFCSRQSRKSATDDGRGLQLRLGVPDPHEFVCVREGKRAKKDCVDDAEDRAVCAYAERERKDCERGKGGLFNRHPNRVAKVLQKGFHPGTSSGAGLLENDAAADA